MEEKNDLITDQCEFQLNCQGRWHCPKCGFTSRHQSNQPPKKNCVKPKVEMPGLLERVGNLATAVVDFVADGCQCVDDTEYERRLAICEKCDRTKDGWCGVCGCNLKIKAKGKIWNCPLDRWDTETENPTP